jgi:hypothetical protein
MKFQLPVVQWAAAALCTTLSRSAGVCLESSRSGPRFSWLFPPRRRTVGWLWKWQHRFCGGFVTVEVVRWCGVGVAVVMVGGCFADLVRRWRFCGFGVDLVVVVVVAARVAVWRWWSGVVVVRCWCGGVWIYRRRCLVDAVCEWFFDDVVILWPLSKFVEICRIHFESLLVSKSVEICRFLVYLIDLYRSGVDCLGLSANRDSSAKFSFYRCSINFWLTELLWDSDGPSTFDSSSGVSV